MVRSEANVDKSLSFFLNPSLKNNQKAVSLSTYYGGFDLYFETTNILVLIFLFNPIRRGAFKGPPDQKSRFWHLFLIQMTRKHLTFPKYL